MRRLVVTAVLATAFFVFGPAASAATTLGALVPAFATKVQERLAVLTGPLSKDDKKRKAALSKAAKALAVRTDDVAKTLADAGKAVGPLEPLYAQDSQFPAIFDSVVGQLHGLVTERAGVIAGAIDQLPIGKVKTAATKCREQADAAEARFGAATTYAARLKAVSQTFAAVAKGEKILAKPGPGLVAITRVDAFLGKTRVFSPGLPPLYLIRAIYDQTGTGAFTLSLDAGRTADRPAFSLFVGSPGIGAQPVVVSADSWYSPTGGAATVPATLGTVTFSVWDPTNRRAQGTFTATFSDGTKVTKGLFSTVDLDVR